MSYTTLGLGTRLRQERERLGLSQTELGEIGGVRKQAQMLYEAGKNVPNAEYLTAVAKVGVDVDYLLTGQTAEVRMKESQRRLFSVVEMVADVTMLLGIQEKLSTEDMKLYIQHALESGESAEEFTRTAKSMYAIKQAAEKSAVSASTSKPDLPAKPKPRK